MKKLKIRKGCKIIARLPDGEAQGLELIKIGEKSYLIAWVSNVGYLIKI